ncbi:hypothetical protein E4U43_008579 [Claviceps pusilla]|uniref:Uncharacterized protein n=1 Tax=Claviceps pusilla TaxID=123648 RepID=A0A9P7SX65_9HYPO|nr:hypothetical protein E4U43_008579 [Claviceps pusilla]
MYAAHYVSPPPSPLLWRTSEDPDKKAGLSALSKKAESRKHELVEGSKSDYPSGATTSDHNGPNNNNNNDDDDDDDDGRARGYSVRCISSRCLSMLSSIAPGALDCPCRHRVRMPGIAIRDVPRI